MSLYRRILGEKYAVMPKAVQELHNVTTELNYAGNCRVKRGRGKLSNLFADILSLPKSGEDVEVKVNLQAKGEKELWSRRFNGKPFKSLQWQVGDLLYERLNFTTLVFKIVVNEQMLDLELQQVYIFGIPQMRFLRPKVIARETEQGGRFHFFIHTSLPFFGHLIEYEGELIKVA